MPSQPPLPPLLAPYLSTQPESSLTLVSSILGATSNWLVLRFLHAALSNPSNNASIGLEDSPDGKKKKVVFVSFLRGWEFWKAEAKRLVS
jgi:elongator complex protein 6